MWGEHAGGAICGPLGRTRVQLEVSGPAPGQWITRTPAALCARRFRGSFFRRASHNQPVGPRTARAGRGARWGGPLARNQRADVVTAPLCTASTENRLWVNDAKARGHITPGGRRPDPTHDPRYPVHTTRTPSACDMAAWRCRRRALAGGRRARTRRGECFAPSARPPTESLTSEAG